MPSDDIDREILLRIPNAGDMSDDELAQALLGIDWVAADGEDSSSSSSGTGGDEVTRFGLTGFSLVRYGLSRSLNDRT